MRSCCGEETSPTTRALRSPVHRESITSSTWMPRIKVRVVRPNRRPNRRPRQAPRMTRLDRARGGEVTLVVLLHVTALAAVARPGSSNAEAQLLAHGTDDAYWIARVEPIETSTGLGSGGGGGGVRSTFQVRTNFDGKWKLVGSLDSRAVALA